jgi:hypothetical protein
MHPVMLNELIKTNYQEQVERHQKLVRLRQLEIHDRPKIDTADWLPVEILPPGALVGKIAGWLGRLRPARAN